MNLFTHSNATLIDVLSFRVAVFRLRNRDMRTDMQSLGETNHTHMQIRLHAHYNLFKLFFLLFLSNTLLFVRTMLFRVPIFPNLTFSFSAPLGSEVGDEECGSESSPSSSFMSFPFSVLPPPLAPELQLFNPCTPAKSLALLAYSS